MARITDPVPELKRQLAAQLVRIMDGWSTTDLIARMRIDQPRISDLRRGRLERFSVERLIRWLYQMKHQIELTVVDDQRRAEGGGRRREAHGKTGM